MPRLCLEPPRSSVVTAVNGDRADVAVAWASAWLQWSGVPRPPSMPCAAARGIAPKLARPVAVCRDRRQLLALRSVDNHAYSLSHRPISPKQCPSIADPNALVNPLNGAKH